MKNLKITGRLLLLVSIFFFASKLHKVSAQSPTITLDHYDLLVSLGSPKMSPDGRKILLLNRKADIKENNYVNTLWLVDKETKEAKPLTHNRPSVSQP